jgi:hypothetical protein
VAWDQAKACSSSYTGSPNKGQEIIMSLDEALKILTTEELAEYEELIELWITYGGD